MYWNAPVASSALKAANPPLSVRQLTTVPSHRMHRLCAPWVVIALAGCHLTLIALQDPAVRIPPASPRVNRGPTALRAAPARQIAERASCVLLQPLRRCALLVHSVQPSRPTPLSAQRAQPALLLVRGWAVVLLYRAGMAATAPRGAPWSGTAQQGGSVPTHQYKSNVRINHTAHQAPSCPWRVPLVSIVTPRPKLPNAPRAAIAQSTLRSRLNVNRAPGVQLAPWSRSRVSWAIIARRIQSMPPAVRPHSIVLNPQSSDPVGAVASVRLDQPTRRTVLSALSAPLQPSKCRAIHRSFVRPVPRA